jgi:hypothetical protein
VPFAEKQAVVDVEVEDAARRRVDAEDVLDADIGSMRSHPTRPATERVQHSMQILASRRIDQHVQV